MRKEIKFYIKDCTDSKGSKVEYKQLLGMMVVDYGSDNNGDYIFFELDIQE